MASFYQVTLVTKPGIAADELQKVMDLALDWTRIHANSWIIYSSSNADKWYERLEPLIKPNGVLFICKLDISERQGWMSKKFWAWLRKNRQYPTT
jgi:hypothetical protein